MKARGVEDLPEKEAEQVQTIVRVLNCKNHYEVTFLRPLLFYQAGAHHKLWRHIAVKKRRKRVETTMATRPRLLMRPGNMSKLRIYGVQFRARQAGAFTSRLHTRPLSCKHRDTYQKKPSNRRSDGFRFKTTTKRIEMQSSHEMEPTCVELTLVFDLLCAVFFLKQKHISHAY
jgi:hypothetical protein